MSEKKKQIQAENNFFKSMYTSFKRKVAGCRSKFEQHIALFGESGSGKTTLLTFFYGYQQGVQFQKEAGYSLLAEDTSQGQALLNSYYKISEQSLPATRLTSREYRFNIRLREVAQNVGRLVWYDYPGGWWTETRTGEEQEDKIKTFLSLMSSDVAFFLVDGAKYKENGDRYLKRLFSQLKDEIIRLKNDPFLKDKIPLAHFPRIWTICLTKSDLMPKMTAEEFRKRVMTTAHDEIQEVRRVIQSVIEEPEYFNLGNDYLLLSVAEYDADNVKIKDIKKQKGIDLIAPVAFTVPVKRSLWWSEKKKQVTSITGETLEITRKLTTGWMKWIPLVGYYFGLVDQMTKKQVANLHESKEKAIRNGYYKDAILIAFEQKMNSPGIENIYIADTK